MRPKETIYLWPGGAPGAMGDSEEHRPRLVPFLLDGQDRSCIIVCPGGGYGMRAPHEGDPVCRWLNTLGISALTLHYRVAPYRHPQPLADAQRAIRLVRHNAGAWGIAPDRIGILGFSAGGHLAGSAGTCFNAETALPVDDADKQSARPDAMVLCYAVTSFSVSREARSMYRLLGDNPPELSRQLLSVEMSISPQTPPTFLWHTADDPVVPVDCSLVVASALARHKVPCELHVYPHGRHGLGLAPQEPAVSDWTRQCARWLKDLGWRRG